MSYIRIKRSSVAGNPSALVSGELAYSSLADNGANGGDRLYIGVGVDSGSPLNAGSHVVIGGKYYTSLIDASGTGGTLNISAKSIPVLSATGTIDQWLVGNLKLTGNTLSSTDLNGNLILSPNGTGLVQISGAWTLPSGQGTNGQVLTTNGTGSASWQTITANPILSIAGNSTTGTVTLSNQALSIVGSGAVSVAVVGTTATISAASATTTSLGVASFDSGSFTVSAGAVSIKTGGVSNTQLANSSVTVNGTSVSLGGSITVSANTTNALTAGTGISYSAGTTFNGSSAVTISLNTATVMATALNASKVANALSTGTGLLGSTFDGSSAVTWSLNTSTVMATALNAGTASKVANALTISTGLTLNSGSTFDGSTAVTLTLNTATVMATALNAGKVANSLTAGTGISYNAGTTFDGSSAVTISLNTATLMNSAVNLSGGTFNASTGSFSGNVTFNGQVIFNGTSTTVASTNTVYTDNMLELHVPPGGTTSTWSYNDGKDIGFRFHYYSSNADQNAALVLAQDTGYLEWYDTGTENGSGVFIGTHYGTIKASGITLSGTVTATNVLIGGSAAITLGSISVSTAAASGGGGLSYSNSTGVFTFTPVETTVLASTSTSQTLTNKTMGSGSTWNGNTVTAAYGGTGITSYSSYDLIYGTTSGPLGKLPIGSAGQILQVSTNTNTLVYGDIDGGTY